MFANWKTAVYEYAHRRSRLESDGDIGRIAAMVRDDRFIRRLDSRMRRARSSRALRAVELQRSETGLKLLHVEESGRQAVVQLVLRRSIDYMQRGRAFREELMEPETVTVERKAGQWIVTGAVSREGEIAREGPLPQFEREPTGEEQEERLLALPYLNHRVLPAVAVEPPQRTFRYDRARARRYAETWWNGTNPRYEHFEADCTNFVSQCLFAGGAPMNYTGKRESGWWYQGRDGSRELWSYSWAVAHALHTLLSTSKRGLGAERVNLPHQLSIGDVICYDWDGNGRFQHNAIVTDFDADGMPLVNAHTANSRMRYWDYKDSYAWTPDTIYHFFHITDTFWR